MGPPTNVVPPHNSDPPPPPTFPLTTPPPLRVDRLPLTLTASRSPDTCLPLNLPPLSVTSPALAPPLTS
jgi:hypothetical protein